MTVHSIFQHIQLFDLTDKLDIHYSNQNCYRQMVKIEKNAVILQFIDDSSHIFIKNIICPNNDIYILIKVFLKFHKKAI